MRTLFYTTWTLHVGIDNSENNKDMHVNKDMTRGEIEYETARNDV